MCVAYDSVWYNITTPLRRDNAAGTPQIGDGRPDLTLFLMFTIHLFILFFLNKPETKPLKSTNQLLVFTLVTYYSIIINNN